MPVAEKNRTETASNSVALARGLQELISADAQSSEAQGRLTDRVTQALLEARLFQILVPTAWGGHGANLEAYFETISIISHADGAAGWCTSICNSNSHILARGLDDQGKAAVFGAGPVAIWGALQPKGVSEAVDGGFILSGDFAWGSGSAQSEWVEVSSIFQGEDGLPWFRVHVVPKAQVTIDGASWDVMGLRATTSINYRIDKVFVPTHMTLSYPLSGDSFLTQKLAGANIGARRVAGRITAADHAASGLAGLSGWSYGVAQRALDELVAKAGQIARLTSSTTQSEDVSVQIGLAEVDGALRSARRAMLSLLADADVLRSRGEGVDTDLRIEVMQAGLTVTRAARAATLFAFDNAGSSVIQMSNPIQRCLRDLLTGLKHAAASPAIFARVGKARLGHENVGL